MGHADKRRIAAWLQDLRAKHYLEWIYDGHDFAKKTQPAIYYLGINGIRLFRTRDPEEYPIEELRKRYREDTRSRAYIDRCLLLADCCVALQQVNDDDTDTSKSYYYETEAEYLSESFFHFLTDSELIHPHLCFSRLDYESGGEPVTEHTYFLEVFDANYPRYRMAKRLKDYIEYLDDKEWEGATEDDKAPIILLVCPRTTDLIYAKRRTRGLYSSQYIQDKDTPKEERLHIRFTTAEKLRQLGVLGDIWEEA